MWRTLALTVGVIGSSAATGRAGPPPLLIRHPVHQRVMAGHSVRLIGGTSDPRAGFQWEKNGVPLPNAITPELRLRHVQPADAGEYRLVVRNADAVPGAPPVGESVSRAATVTVIMPPQAAGMVDPAVADAAIGGGDVTTIALRTGGGCMIAGDFTNAGGWPLGRLAKVEADGSVDLSFPVGSGADERIRAIAANGGGWLIGGDFATFSNQPAARLARVTDGGLLDPTFAPPPLLANVRALAVMPVGNEDRILVGLSASPWLQRLMPDGKPDAEFNANVASAGLNGRVSAIAVRNDGRILIGGSFFIDGPRKFERIGQLLSDGRPDWAGFPNDTGTGADAEVQAIALAPGGRVVVGGRFTSVHGQVRFFLARLLENGQLDAEFNPAPNDGIDGLAVLPDGRVYAAGRFSRIDNGSVRSLVRLTSNGRNDPDWTLPAFDEDALAVAIDGDGNLWAGGEFTQPHLRLVRLMGAVEPAPPTLLAPPSDQSLEFGQGGSLTVPTMAIPGTTLTWRRNGDIVGITQTGELLIPRVGLEHSGPHTVEMSNSHGTVTSESFEVIVRGPSPGARPVIRSVAAGLPRVLLNQGVVASSIRLPALDVAEVRVTFAIAHNDINDLLIELVAPGGMTVSLFDPENPSNVPSGRNFGLTMLADDAPDLINEAGAPYVGSFRPSAADIPGSTVPSLRSLAGLRPAGDWVLRIDDTRPDSNTGTLHFFALDIFGPAPPVDGLWDGPPPPGGSPAALRLDSPGTVAIRHWIPPAGGAIEAEWSPDLSLWNPFPPGSLRALRLFADQSFMATLARPDFLAGSCFIRLRAH